VDVKDSLKTEHPLLPAADSGKTGAGARADLKTNRDARLTGPDTRIEQAEMRTELAKTRREQGEIRIEQVKLQVEQSEIRSEQAEIRTEQAENRIELEEIRSEQAHLTAQGGGQQEMDSVPDFSRRFLHQIPTPEMAERQRMLHQLTSRQSEVLQFIAEGQNTKQIAANMNVSPKTVEYHRMKLMNCLNIHDIVGLVRFAMQAGLLPQAKLLLG
jgi:DNA-binding CsgD family transcriptional regulator